LRVLKPLRAYPVNHPNPCFPVQSTQDQK